MEIRKLTDKTIYLRGKKEGVVVGGGVAGGKLNYRVLLSTDNYCNSEMSSDKVIIAAPGEYEIGGVEFLGVSGGGGKTVYVVNMDGVRVGILGALLEPLTDKRVERIDEVDVLLVSLDKEANITTKQVLEWTKKWGANYLVPYGYKNDTDEKLKKFLDEVDSEGASGVESLKIDKDNLPEGMEVVVLKNTMAT